MPKLKHACAHTQICITQEIYYFCQRNVPVTAILSSELLAVLLLSRMRYTSFSKYMSTSHLIHCVPLNRDGIQGVWGYERDCLSERVRCRKGEVTCSHKDGTQQHEHRAAAKNKHCLKARVRQKEQETLLSPRCGYTDARTTPPLYTTSSVNLS